MRFLLVLVLFISGLLPVSGQTNLYFPPLAGNQWQTIDPGQLGYCPERIDSLYQFLGENNTKGFLLIKDGKIVLEKYFNTFTADSIWYWASAGKSLSAWLLGVVKEQNGVDIEAPASTYLGTGWTSTTPAQEEQIKVRHLLSMSSGLDDVVTAPVSDPGNCTDPVCFQYKAAPGTRWAYHNGAYFMVQEIVEKASGVSLNLFTKTSIFDKIGARGLWIDHVMYSTPRNMARFGLLALADGIWAGDSILKDKGYLQAMHSTSQPMNQSYGYLWWLNGKQSFMLPQVQLVLPGALCANAPSDAWFALGKNDQKIHVAPSKGLVVVRMGNASGFVTPNGNTVPILFDNAMWQYINALTCVTDATEPFTDAQVRVSPNPTTDVWHAQFASEVINSWQLYDQFGKLIQTGQAAGNSVTVEAEYLAPGVYWFVCGRQRLKLMKY